MIYIALFVTFSFLSFIELNFAFRSVKLNLSLIYILCTLVLIVIAGTRLIGFDYDNYEHLYNDVTLSNYIENAIEVGYAMITISAKSLGLTFHQFSFILALVSISMKMRFTYRWSDNWFLALTYYFAIGFTMNEMGQIRHGLAIGIVLLAFSDIFKGNSKGFYIKTFIAFAIHASAIVVFPIYYLAKKRLSFGKTLLFCAPLLVFVFIDLKKILTIFLDYLPLSQIQIKIASYVLSEELGKRLGFNISLLLRLIFLALLYIYREIGRYRYLYYDKLWKLYLYGVVLYIVFNSIDEMAIRSSLYFKMLECLIIPIIVKLGRGKLEQNIIWALMILYSFWSLFKLLHDPDTGSVYLPYKTYLLSSW